MLERYYSDVPLIVFEVFFNKEMFILILDFQVYLTQLHLVILIILHILVFLGESRDLRPGLYIVLVGGELEEVG